MSSIYLNGFSLFDARTAAQAAEQYGTPLYVYDEKHILKRCGDCLSIPNAYGLTVRYAMKANSNRALLKLISKAGLHFDASSLNEVLRANLAGIPCRDIMLTTQEVYEGKTKAILEGLLLDGLKYNVCSLRQLQLIGGFMTENGISPGVRVHPGVGTGESATRNTGDDYSCFGLHLSDLEEANSYARERGLKFRHVHEHIGSGGDPGIWKTNIDLELSIIEEHFPDADSVSFGGGLREARMPDESPADINDLGLYAKTQIESFYNRTGRKLKIEIEPGTFIIANCGYAVTRIMDKKKTARAAFIITDGGMEINSRPLLYGSRHPIYIASSDGSRVISSEFIESPTDFEAVIAGKCCESGDCQTLGTDGLSITRRMGKAEPGDLAIIGGVGAYCSSMSPFNYNSHTQVPEALFAEDGSLRLIRNRQTLEQMLENEI